MVMRADVLGAAIDAASAGNAGLPRIYLSPRGDLLTQAIVRELAAGPGVLLLAGRFEGIDERVIAARSLREISIGDYVLAGGELAAMVLIDAVVRLLPGVVGHAGFAAGGELRSGPAGVSPVYAPARVGGRGNSPSPALRRSQAYRRVATHARQSGSPASAGRTCGARAATKASRGYSHRLPARLPERRTAPANNANFVFIFRSCR